MESAITVPSPDSSSAAVVTDMMITISFCLIGMSRKGCIIWSAISPRTCATLISLELMVSMALGRSALIDVEPHAAILDDESDDAAILQELSAFADGQNSRAQLSQNPARLFLRSRDK